MEPKTMIDCFKEININKKELVIEVVDLFKIPDILYLIKFMMEKGFEGNE